MRFRRSSRSLIPSPQQQIQSRLDDYYAQQIEAMKELKAMTDLALPAPEPTFPVTQGDEPIRALKAAHLILSGAGVEFASLNQFGHHFGYAQHATYGPEAQAACHCTGSESLSSWSLLSTYTYRNHTNIETSSECGFYAWKDRNQFPWQAGTWLLEVDLFGRVIEHELGYRATRQRVLRISPVTCFACEPLQLVANLNTKYITAICSHVSHERPTNHPVSVEQLRGMLNVEVDLDWATQMRSGQ